MTTTRRLISIATLSLALLGLAGRATAAVPPYAPAEEYTAHQGSEQSFYDLFADFGTTSGYGQADHATGAVRSVAEARSTMPVGTVPVFGTIHSVAADSYAGFRISRLVGPGDYVVLARFDDTAVAASVTPGTVTSLGPPVPLTYLTARAWAEISAGCSGCSVSMPSSTSLTATPKDLAAVVAVTVPAGPAVTLTATAYIRVRSDTRGEGITSADASGTITRVSVLRGEEEV